MVDAKEIEILLPKLGESIVSATVVQWFKKEGDLVKLDEPLLEVSTDKVNSEIPSPVSGKLTRILAYPDEELDVGAPLGCVATVEISNSEKIAQPQQEVESSSDRSCSSKKGFFTPVVLKIAQEKGINLSELEHIQGTGAGGRLSKRDLEHYFKHRSKGSSSLAGERIPMTSMRKMIADNMVRSFYEAPHATLVNEVDVTKLMAQIAQEKESFLKKNGYKLTITSFIARAIGQAALEFPLINATLEGETIVCKKGVNLGIAVSVDQGILVPVIHNCDSRSLKEIAGDMAALSASARKGKLEPDQVKEGTLTMTNFGMSGTLLGTPIIRYGEVAIVGVGAINKKVVVLEGDTMAIRSMMYLTLTFDHRVLDGMYGCGYLAAVKRHLEESIDLL